MYGAYHLERKENVQKNFTYDDDDDDDDAGVCDDDHDDDSEMFSTILM